jgi:hypothetical protein
VGVTIESYGKVEISYINGDIIIYLPTYQILMISDNVEFCGIVAAILKMVTGRNCSISPYRESIRTPLSTHISNLESYGKVEISYINVDNF